MEEGFEAKDEVSEKKIVSELAMQQDRNKRSGIPCLSEAPTYFQKGYPKEEEDSHRSIPNVTSCS
jgi:hypothetical protein